MGRGLAAILSVSGEPSEDDVQLREIPVELIAPNPRQPRRDFDEDLHAAPTMIIDINRMRRRRGG
jgi:hypothetical protein